TSTLRISPLILIAKVMTYFSLAAISIFDDLDDGIGKRFWGFLRQIVVYPAGDYHACGCPKISRHRNSPPRAARRSHRLQRAHWSKYFSHGSAQRFERCSHLGDEELRLLPSREVCALVELVVVNELGVCLLGPALRCLVDLFGESADGDRN